MSNIELYIKSNTTRKAQTSDNMIRDLNNVKVNLDTTDQQGIWDSIFNRTDIKDSRKELLLKYVKGYLIHYKLPYDIFEFRLKKTEKNGVWDTYNFNLNDSGVEKPIKKKISLKLEELKDKIKLIQNPEHKLIFNLLTNYIEIERLDLCLVKVSNYDKEKDHYFDGVSKIVMNSTNKKFKTIIIDLHQEDLDLIEEYKKDGDYMINIKKNKNSKTCIKKRRCNNYSGIIKKLTLEYFGEELINTDFRRLATKLSFKKVEHLPSEEKMIVLKSDAEKRGHSIEVAVKYYLDETDDKTTNISLKYKDSITILDKDDKVIGTYLLSDIIKKMNID
jgi:hypothetical protein